MTVYSRTHAEGGSPIWNLVFPRQKEREIAAGNTSGFYLEMAYHSHSYLMLLFSLSVMFDSFRLCGLQHTRLPRPSLSTGVCSNSCPLSQWCQSIISSSVAPFSCPQSFPASGSFPVSRLFASGGQSIAASASALPMNIQGWFPLGLNDLISLQSQGTLKSLLQHHNSKASILWCSTFFMIHLSH